MYNNKNTTINVQKRTKKHQNLSIITIIIHKLNNIP